MATQYVGQPLIRALAQTLLDLPGPMVLGQQRFEVRGPQLNLRAIGLQQSRCSLALLASRLRLCLLYLHCAGLATQQAYAGSSSLVEPGQMRELVEDALRINDDSLARHRVIVVKEFADVPLVRLDKTRVMQILVNLISNAKNAMDGVTDRPHRMPLQMDVTGSTLRVCVKDEGEGIPAENLTRIFAHGFTTRKAGHGFGLHSCALAARQMGGTLTAHSNGPGQGATLTLELPINTS